MAAEFTVYLDDFIEGVTPETATTTISLSPSVTIATAGAINETAYISNIPAAASYLSHVPGATTVGGISGIISASASLLVSAKICASITDKMVRGDFEFDEATTGGVFSGNYFKHITLQIPDYAGTNQTVFCGFFPSSKAQFAPADDRETLTAYDYAWYLTMQYLTDSDLVLLTPADQAAVTKYQLEFDFQEHYFQPGMWVVGGTTGHTGRIIEVRSGVISAVILENPTGIFQDDEQLLVSGIRYAYADGTAVDVTGTVDTIYPEDWIRTVLGGTDWARVTGIEPYKLASTAGIWGVSIPAVNMTFGEKQTKMSAIEQLSEYMNRIFYVKYRDAGTGVMQPCAYWVSEADIDDGSAGLDLPAPVTITAPNEYLVSPVMLEQDGSQKYNKVTVRCQSWTTAGTWYSKTIQSSGVDDGTEIPIEYYEVNPDIASQAECTNRCQDLYDYYHMQVMTWKATFLKRSDFRLLQKITFSGYGTEIPDGDYRIIGIEYNYANGGTVNEVTCSLVMNSAFSAYLSLNRCFTDTIKEVQAMVKYELAKQGAVEAGTITAIDGAEVTVTTERGITKIVRTAG